jgi:thymidylate synthase
MSEEEKHLMIKTRRPFTPEEDELIKFWMTQDNISKYKPTSRNFWDEVKRQATCGSLADRDGGSIAQRCRALKQLTKDRPPKMRKVTTDHKQEEEQDPILLFQECLASGKRLSELDEQVKQAQQVLQQLEQKHETLLESTCVMWAKLRAVAPHMPH